MRSSPVVILGMHRSGTTMLSKILEQLGVFMGWKKDENNEATFFLRFNDWVLKQANATWDNPYNYTISGEYFKNLMVKLANRYVNSIRIIEYLGFQKFFKYKTLEILDFPWGWKDPRNTFTIDIWNTVFPNAIVLHVYRNPIDVAESLRKRAIRGRLNFKWTLKKEIMMLMTLGRIFGDDSVRVENLLEGIKLWREYVLRVFELEEKQRLRVLHIKYEEFLENPIELLENILTYINLDVSREKLGKVKQFVNPARMYAFLSDRDLIELYMSIKDDDLMERLGYNNII